MTASKQLLTSGWNAALRHFPRLITARDVPLPASDASTELVSNRKFIVKLLASRREFLRVQKLRYDVFHREFRKKKFPIGFDRDRYDEGAAHLIVVERDSGRIVGSYRSILAHEPEALYTASEFDVGSFAQLSGPKLELSRACIHKDFRTGAVLSLLWKGIGEYINRTRAGWLFGIPSIKSTDVHMAVDIYRYFQAMDRIATKLAVKPLASHQLPGFSELLATLAQKPLTEEELKEVAGRIPPLFHIYVKAGARIAGEPALDRAFQCIDFFMALEVNEMTAAFKRKYVQ